MVDGSKPAKGKLGKVDGALPSGGPGKKKCPGPVMCGIGRARASHLLCFPSSASADNRRPEPSTSPAPAAVPAAPRMRLRRVSHFSCSFFHEIDFSSFIVLLLRLMGSARKKSVP